MVFSVLLHQCLLFVIYHLALLMTEYADFSFLNRWILWMSFEEVFVCENSDPGFYGCRLAEIFLWIAYDAVTDFACVLPAWFLISDLVAYAPHLLLDGIFRVRKLHLPREEQRVVMEPRFHRIIVFRVREIPLLRY